MVGGVAGGVGRPVGRSAVEGDHPARRRREQLHLSRSLRWGRSRFRSPRSTCRSTPSASTCSLIPWGRTRRGPCRSSGARSARTSRPTGRSSPGSGSRQPPRATGSRSWQRPTRRTPAPSRRPRSVGTVAFSAASDGVTATLTGSSLLLAQHLASILLVDASTGAPVTMGYALDSVRTRGGGWDDRDGEDSVQWEHAIFGERSGALDARYDPRGERDAVPPVKLPLLTPPAPRAPSGRREPRERGRRRRGKSALSAAKAPPTNGAEGPSCA